MKMEKLALTQEQIKTIFFTQAKESVNDFIKLVFETLMRVEREIYKTETGDVSNGYRPRRFIGQGKILELQVPRTRQGGFYPQLLAILKDQQEESLNIAFTLYQKGLTDSEIGEVLEQLYGKHYSRSRVSQIVNEVKDEIEMWRNRELEAYYPVIYIDAIYQYVRVDGTVKKLPFYVVLGIKEDFTREILAIETFATESSEGWASMFEGLIKRGVKEITLVVSDALTGIENAVSKVLKSEHQLCVTHLKRNVLGKVSKKDRTEMANDLREIFKTTDKNDAPEKGWQRWNEFIDKWSKKYRFLSSYKSDRYRLYFTYLGYDYNIRSMIYTTNWIERFNRQLRRVTRMRASMPTIDSVLNLFIGASISYKAYKRKLPKFEYEDKKFVYKKQKK